MEAKYQNQAKLFYEEQATKLQAQIREALPNPAQTRQANDPTPGDAGDAGDTAPVAPPPPASTTVVPVLRGPRRGSRGSDSTTTAEVLSPPPATQPALHHF